MSANVIDGDKDPWTESTGQRGYERETYERACNTNLLPELTIFGWLRFHNSLSGALRPDSHPDEYEIHYFRRGHLCWWVEEENHELNPHSLLIICPGERHGGEGNSIQPCEHYWLRFSFRKSSPLTGLSAKETNFLREGFETLIHRCFVGSQEINQFFELLLHEHRRAEQPDATSVARLMFHALLFHILRDHARMAAVSARKPMVSWLTRKARELIQEQCSKPEMDIRSIARHLKISESGLRARFKKETNENLHEYWLRFRIEKAKRLLTTTQTDIMQIAISLGFSSGQYFSTVFKKHVGSNPRYYRTNNS